MHYIVFDLEFNQDIPSLKNNSINKGKYPFEIIQIGAIKLDSNLNTRGTFNSYVKPKIYSQVNPFITELTKITTEQLEEEKFFPDVYKAFMKFIDDEECIFCIWGMSDIKELFKNIHYHKLDNKRLSRSYINIQPNVSKYLGLSSKKLLRLQSAVESLGISKPYEFHNALYDAYYTAEIFKKIYYPSIKPKEYDPHYIKIRPKKRKEEIDYESLIKQFDKMFGRKMSKGEEEIIKLAYKMGRTRQFVKQS